MSASAPLEASTPRAARRSRLLVPGIAAYLILVSGAFATGISILGGLAAFVLVSLILGPGLRRRSTPAWAAWCAATAAIGLLLLRGAGALALDAMPVLVNVALCWLFARTLRRGREPLIAQFIRVIEGPQRLALPKVAAYARGLTLTWSVLLGAQAGVLALLLVWSAAAGANLLAVPGSAWRIYLHLGSYALVPAFLILEYAYRRWHLRDVPHLPLAQFIARLAHCWRSMLHDLVAAPARHPQ